MQIVLEQKLLGDELRWFAIIHRTEEQERFWILREEDAEYIAGLLKRDL